MIGDVILFYLGPNQFNLVGRIPSLNWVLYHAATGGYDVQVELDERSAARPDPFNRKSFRFQLQGPNAMKTMEKVLGTLPPELKFFTMGHVTIAGRPVRVLRHGMAGQPGFELFGPYAERRGSRGDLQGRRGIRPAAGGRPRLLGQHAGIRAGSRRRCRPCIPASQLKPYREWLPADGYEAKASIGGSFNSPNIEDFYLTPWDLGYGPHVKFDHDFIGREALEKRAKSPHRSKVTLALNTDDVMRVIGSQFQRDHRAKFIEFPLGGLLDAPYDKVTKNGKTVGVSTWVGYSANAGPDADAGDSRAGARGDRQRGDLRLGRGERRHRQAGGGAARTGGDAGHRQPGAVQRGGAHRIRRRRWLRPHRYVDRSFDA